MNERMNEWRPHSHLAHLEIEMIASFMPVLPKLSTCGLPLGEEGHAEHLIHSSWLLIRETNLTRARGKRGVVKMGCQWGKLYTLSIMQ